MLCCLIPPLQRESLQLCSIQYANCWQRCMSLNNICCAPSTTFPSITVISINAKIVPFIQMACTACHGKQVLGFYLLLKKHKKHESNHCSDLLHHKIPILIDRNQCSLLSNEQLYHCLLLVSQSLSPVLYNADYLG